MQKVLLTKEQADQVEEIISERSVWHQLKDLSREELGLVISGHYDMVPEPPKLQPGDLVVRKDGHPLYGKEKIGTIARKVKFSYESITVEGSEMIRHIHRSKIRHATEEEVYWLKTLGREKVPHFLKEDVYVDKDGNGVSLGTQQHIDHANRTYANGDFQGIHPIESFKPYHKEN